MWFAERGKMPLPLYWLQFVAVIDGSAEAFPPKASPATTSATTHTILVNLVMAPDARQRL
jgi:hypothetical protein